MEHEMMEHSEILLYSDETGKEFVNVVFMDETFWLTQVGMAELFDSSKSNVSEHLSHIFEEEELDKASCMRKFGISEFSTKPTNFYNLDAIIAVGYRVNSKKATRFRQWATKTLKEYIQKGFVLNDELMKNGKVSRGRLGILMQQLTPELAKSFNLKDAKGALIAQIEKDGPADKAGLRDGDIVIEYNGKPIADIRELSQAVASTKPGAKVKVKAMREGKPVNLVIVVGEMPTDGKLNFKKPAASQNNALGANVRPLNDKEKKRVSNGLFVESVYGAAAEAGMRRGDIIISAGGKKIRTEKDLNEVVSKVKGSLAVLVDRNGSREFIPVKLSDEAKK